MSGLPNGWAQTRLAEISLIEMGQSPDSETYNAEGVGLPFFQGKAEFRETFPEIKKWCSSPTKIAEPGDILLSIRAPVGPTNLAPTKCCIGRGLAGIRSEAGIDQDYLFYFFKSIEPWLSIQGTGSTFAAISGQFVKDIQVPIPPTNEQTRIVEKLEELLTDLDAGVAELKTAQKKLAQYRQALLKAAVEGKLTRAWREQRGAPSPQPLSHQGRGAYAGDSVNDAAANYRLHSPFTESTSIPLPSPLVGEGPGERGHCEPAQFETGAQLLERILKERRARWEAKQLTRFQAQGKAPPKDWQNKYPEPVKPDTANLSELPEGWIWVSLDMLGEIASGVAKGTKRNPEILVREVPYLRVANVQRGFLDLSEVKTILATEPDIAELTLLPGDILFNEGGDRDKLGRGWVWRGEVPECIHQNHVFRMRPFLPDIVPELISHHGNTFGKTWFQNAGKQTTNLASINMTMLRMFPVPLGPASEQQEILSLLQFQLDNLDQQEKSVELGLKQSTAQRQNILRTAFAGQLVPQDPNDEPAGVLLERIRAEQAAKTGNRKKARTKGKDPA